MTEDEIYALWKVKNINWYLKNGYAPQTGSIAPWRQRWLLEDFIGAADTLVDNRKFHGATLRFGHEGCLMPLVALMELGTLNSEVQDLDTLDRVFHQTVRKVSSDFESLGFNTAISQMMIFVNACYKAGKCPKAYA